MRGKHVRLSPAKALSIYHSRKTDNKFHSLYPLLVTWLLGSSFIILITIQANIIHGVSNLCSYSGCYLIAGSCQNHFNDVQTFEILKQTQRQTSVKELKSDDRAGALPSSCQCWCAAWPWMLLWGNRPTPVDPEKDLFEGLANL